MKKTTKRLISILLSLLLLVSVGALSILAADVEVDEENERMVIVSPKKNKKEAEE